MDRTLAGLAPRLASRASPPSCLLLPGVHLFDPAVGVDAVADLLVQEGSIAAIEEGVAAPRGCQVLDHLTGCHVFPGFVDIHTHLRTPGFEYKEDVESAGMAAAAGGFVSIIGMANTDPAVDSGPLVDWVLTEAAARSPVRIGQVGAVSRGLKGEQLADLRELVDAGAAAFADDGHPLNNTDLLLHALRYLRGTGKVVLLHLEDWDLSADGVMHQGRWSARLGLRGVPAAAESGPMARDLEVIRYASAEAERLASVTLAGRQRVDGPTLCLGEVADPAASPGRQAAILDRAAATRDGWQAATPVHFQHLSAEASVYLLRVAKAEGLPVTAEVTPHHLLLTDELVQTFDQSLRINPPLRSEEDRQALIEALAEGVIDCVATDHAPHAPHEKEVPFEDAASGTIGLETAFAALYGTLVKAGSLPLSRLVEAMSTAPCRCLGMEAPRLELGRPADLCVVGLDQEWEVAPGDLRGKSRNSAFLGRRVQGRIMLTVVDGAVRFSRARKG